MKYALESSRFFPYIAWTLVISFAFFTYSLTMQLRGELNDINNSIQRIETKINTFETSTGRQSNIG